jgi:hypothetical protein
MHFNRSVTAASVALLLAASASAQWNPPTGQWGKVDPADLRVETYNVQDAICSTNTKVEGANNWCALAHIIASLKPDVLLLQECADNSGNGTGSGVDSVATLTTVVANFLHGGVDTFHGNTPVTAYVQKYAPTYDLPYVFVANVTDGFNRNVICSRYPFTDLNGDGKSVYDNIPTVSADQWAPGGDGGIRGFQFVEVALPHLTYPGNLVIGAAHLKSGGTSSDHTQRITAAENVSYFVQYWYNANGGTVPDPDNKIADVPPAANVLPTNTPVIMGGDWNEDELTNGTKGPVEWLTQAVTTGSCCDGTDRDGSDMTYDSSVDFFTGSRITESGSKLDYLTWQDSIVALRQSYVFYTVSIPGAAMPPELQTYAAPSSASTTASDHRTVFADLRLPIVDCNHNGIADTTDIATGTSQDANSNGIPDECECSASNYCITSPNSAGPGCTITSFGSLSIAANNFILAADSGPPNKNGIFLYSPNQTQVPFGNGYFCVASPIHRLPAVTFDSLGSLTFNLDFTNLPPSGQIHAGEPWNFQLWYRDPAAGGASLNLSDGRHAVFCP